MKRYSLLLALLLVAFSCQKHNTEEIIPVERTDYEGTVSVEYKGETYDTPGIKVNYAPSEDGSTADITIYRIKFVPQMPVTIDVTIPAVPVDRRENAIFFSGENIVPMALGGEVPRYLVTALSGTIEKDSISFSLNFGDFPTRYSGIQIVE